MSLQRVTAEVERLLAAAVQRDPGIAPFRAMLSDAAPNSDPAATAPPLPVCRFWPAALARPGDGVAQLCAALITLESRLSWTQNPSYRRSPPTPGFLDNYGYAVLAGPADGPPAIARHDQLAFGVLLLGPRTHYPLHHHPAAEVYVPLNSAQWWRDDGPWREEAPGAVIHHPPNMPHATRTGGAPLLALYLWRGALATHAKLTGNPSPQRG
ncbi:MAG: dimethylsulfonioproprionate lyase family protein [Dongiaceae bacterium]